MIVLRFRHGSSGDPNEWEFVGDDENALREMLKELDVYKAETGAQEAVLDAREADGTAIGTWNRGGAAHLASEMFRERTTSPWTDVEAAIQDEVMDPHPDETAPAA
jgi:hypothetical protein